MGKKNKKIDRRIELSNKFLEMGCSLIKEGNELNDYPITQSGNFMILLASIVLEEKDSFEFANLCSMFSAKKIMESMGNFGTDVTNEEMFRKMLGLDDEPTEE
jgi:hypothetical protein